MAFKTKDSKVIKGIPFDVKKFRKIVKSRGQSFTFIAKKAGISLTHLNFIMMKKRNPSMNVLIKISAALGIYYAKLMK